MQFKLASGVQIQSLKGIHNCYELTKYNGRFIYRISLSLDILKELLCSFIKGLREPCFCVLEIPTNGKDEDNSGKIHCDVYYSEEVTRDTLLKIMDNYGDLLLNDGLVNFSFASVEPSNEIYVGKYKITEIYTKNENQYQSLLENYNIVKEEKIKTIIDNLDLNHKGTRLAITHNQISIYDLPELLKNIGLHFVNRAEG